MTALEDSLAICSPPMFVSNRCGSAKAVLSPMTRFPLGATLIVVPDIIAAGPLAMRVVEWPIISPFEGPVAMGRSAMVLNGAAAYVFPKNLGSVGVSPL